MNEQKNNGRGIFYGVIGVATLVVAIIGATFAYFTATASNENTITGNMATVSLGLGVEKMTTAGDVSGLIPMSNTMVEQAIKKVADTKDVCIDDNGNAVCQVYKITLSNSSSAGIFVDGYVALIKGSGTPTDYPSDGETIAVNNATTMRWAQVFPDGDSYTTATTNISLGQTENIPFTSLDAKSDSTGKNQANIRTEWTTFDTSTTQIGTKTFTPIEEKGVLAKATIAGNEYPVIGKNYIRVSDHKFKTADTLSADEVYTQEADVTSALVYNQQVGGTTTPNTPVTKEYYIVVWLSETGTNQTAGSTGAGAAQDPNDFFSGQVKFVSAQGSEVSATFSGYTRVATTDAAKNEQTSGS